MNGVRSLLEGVTVVLPEGWSEVLEDATFSDPDQPPAAAFAAAGGAGTLYISATPLADETTDVEAAPARAEQRVLDWGRRRGLPPPVSYGSEVARQGARATAVFRVGDEFVQIWTVTNGYDYLEATYASRWEAQERDRGGREALIESLGWRAPDYATR